MLQHQELVRVIHDETGKDFGTFRGAEGTGKEGDNQLIRPGGMAAPVAYAGTYEFTELSCTRLLVHTVDSGLLQDAMNLHGERFTIIRQPLDAKQRPGFHKPVTSSGLLNAASGSDYDADGNDPQTLNMAFTVDSVS